MSSVLDSPTPPRAVSPKPQAPAPRATPKVAFDPLDPRWRDGASASPTSTSGATTSAPAPLSAEEQKRAEKVGGLVINARRAFSVGEVGKARSLLREAFALDRTDRDALELLGDIFLAEAEQEKAIAIYERGRALHPSYAGFEEKIGVAMLDAEEEKRDQERARLLIEQGDTGRWLDRKPGLATSLSLLVPGAGQVYNDEAERGYAFFGVALLSFGGWYAIFNAATQSMRGRQILSDLSSVGAGIGGMGAFAKFGFWLLFLAWVGTVLCAAIDAYQGAERANRERRALGL
jgi:tetratricopeptide (TPR) repeat protein